MTFHRAVLGPCVLFAVLMHVGVVPETARAAEPEWKERAIAYLDGRQTWWMNSGMAKRAKGTTCVACHTGLPYALARGSLGGDTTRYQATLANVRKRVELWDSIGPLYADKAEGSRGTEAITNALLLATADANEGRTRPSDSTRKALDHMWALQNPEGPDRGAWPWLHFDEAGFEPWEADDSQSYGAALAALAVATAPAGMASAPRERLGALRSYLNAHGLESNLHNRIVLLWASTKFDGILSPAQEQSLIREIFRLQQHRSGDAAIDGGWSIASLGTWVRKDGTPQKTAPDGYATGLIVHTLELVGVAPEDRPNLLKGLTWLRKNQEAATGAWPGNSVHKQRDPETDEAWKFPRDAATAFATLALVRAE